MNPLLAYTLAPMQLSAFHIPRAVVKQPGNQRAPQLPSQHPVVVLSLDHKIQQVYGAMNLLLVYTLAPMHLSAFHIP